MVGKCVSDGNSELCFDISIQEMDLLVDGAAGCMGYLENEPETMKSS